MKPIRYADFIDGSAPVSEIKACASVSMVAAPIEVNMLDRPYNSALLEQEMRDAGFSISHSQLKIFSATAWGKIRPRKGDFQLDGTPVAGKLTYNEVVKLVTQAIPYIENSIINVNEQTKNSEYDDLKKLAFQRTSYLGKHMRMPTDKESLKTSHAQSFKDMIRRVILHLADKVKKLPKSIIGLEALLEVPVDPEYTNTGAPFFFPGTVDVNVGRASILQDAPPFSWTGSNRSYIGDVSNWISAYGLPSYLKAASYLVYRTGAKVGFYNVYSARTGGFTASYEAKGFNCDARFAWGGSYLWYIALTPAQVMMKRMRQAKLGLFHTTALSDAYLPLLYKRGNNGVTTDFSRYDTTQVLALQLLVVEACMEAFPELAAQFDLMHGILEEVAMIMPYLHNVDTRQVTVLEGPNGLLSGFGFTAEMGTFLGIASMLDGMNQFGLSHLVEAWFNDDHVVLVQSDDNQQFLSDKDFKHFMSIKDEYIDYIKKEQGLKLKVIEGNVFLKRLYKPGIKHNIDTSPLVTRIIQNTLGNEKKVEGKFVLERSQFSFIARCAGLANHPSPKALPFIKEFFNEFDVLKPVIDYVGKDVTSLPQTILKAIQMYGEGVDGQKWMNELLQRVEFDPVAQYMLNTFQEIGINVDEAIAVRREKRKQFYKYLTSPNTGSQAVAIKSVLRLQAGKIKY